MRWAVVVPVKRLAVAKTRLGVADDVRIDLALAMAVDTVTAAQACAVVERVVIVTDEIDAAVAVRRLGALTVADAPDAGLNPALSHGAGEALRGHEGLGIAALSSDLPALRPAALERVLSAAARHSTAVVADAGGAGTTVLTARRAADFAPHFGPESLRAHVGAGARNLTDIAEAAVRRDVDTVDDLRAAARLGLGDATSAVLRRHPSLVAEP
jgi:2-phospho-L-lactate guanylyltransferase